MKKIIQLFFLIFFLIITTVSHSKVITITNCSAWNDQKDSVRGLSKEMHEKNEFIVDTNRKLLKHNSILTDQYIKNTNEMFKKNHGRDLNLSKIYSREYQIEYSDNKFVKASTDVKYSTWNQKEIIELNLNDKLITRTTEEIINGSTRSHQLHSFCSRNENNNKDLLKKVIGK